VNDRIDPDYFAQRELAINRAIWLGQESWSGRDDTNLFDCQAVQPPPAELHVVRQAHARARSLGLMLPPFPKTTVQFVHAPESLRVGAQTRKRDDTIEMVFVAGQPLDWLRRLALHELAHVDQLARGAGLSEEAAEMFAWNALQGWRP
jgi:hypothetical protein